MAITAFAHVHPEVMRRLFAIADLVLDNGSDFGFGGGTREFAEQDAEFRRRHYIVPSGGIWTYDGHRWQRYDWAAPYAPPGYSWHERVSSTHGAIAVDALGDHAMATPMTLEHGLVNHISNEAWHYQALEVPHARSYNLVWGELAVWPLPADQPPIPGDEPDMYQALDSSQRAYDSRPGEQAFIDDVYRVPNAAVPQVPLEPGSFRKVFIGLEKNAHVMITAVGSNPGFVKMAGVAVEPKTSVANIDADGITNGGVPVGTPDGHIYLWSNTTCDVVVDVFARWN